MAAADERMHILQMVADKQITAEEGAKLLGALVNGPVGGTDSTASAARWLRVRVVDIPTGKQKTNVTIPIGLMDVGIRLGARYAPDKTGVDLSTLQAAVRRGLRGKIMEVEDNDGNERVEIFVE
jgi:hypothetical protein